MSGGADQPTWQSPFVHDGFFHRQVPDIPIPGDATVAGVSPGLRRFARGEPGGLVRCLVSANSRGVGPASAGGQTLTEVIS